MKKLLVVASVIVLLFFSCDIDGKPKKEDQVRTKTFWAQNIATNSFYRVPASLLAEGRYCNVWGENSSGVSKDTAREVANAYDNDIYQKMIDTFSVRNFTYSGYNFSNIMDFADTVGDEDGKLTILLLDIKDGYREGVNDAYVAGYFWAGDLLPTQVQNSNGCDMIYIDTYPGVPASEDSNMTLAHEMQHLMNFLTSVIERALPQADGTRVVYMMDLWIDEGLSSAAEYIYLGEHPEDKVEWFNRNGNGGQAKGLIDKGNNFFVWDNRENESTYAVLDDYSTVYLFFQWLRLQADNTSIYKDIISSNQYDHNAVLNALNARPANNYSNWGTLLKTWLAANYINASTGPYGYKNESVLKNLKALTAPTGIQSLPLYPGEGVYSITNTAGSTPAQGTNIKYAGLNNSQVSDSSVYANGALLTYNINEDRNGIAERGTTTGVSASVDIVISEGRSARNTFAGPYRIDAGDLLRRNGNSVDFSDSFKRLEIDE